MTRLNELLDATQTGPEAEQLGASLRERVVGQEEAIGEMTRARELDPVFLLFVPSRGCFFITPAVMTRLAQNCKR